MSNDLRVEIITPERLFFEGDIDSLVVETSVGQLGILAHHAPMAIGLAPGLIKMRTGESVKIAVNGEGFVEVRPDKTVIMCQTMEWPEEVEANRVNKAIEENERRMRETASVVEYKMSKANLARAFARRRVLKK